MPQGISTARTIQAKGQSRIVKLRIWPKFLSTTTMTRSCNLKAAKTKNKLKLAIDAIRDGTCKTIRTAAIKF